MEYGGKCSLCGEGGHRASRCPDLCDPLKEGFFKGGGGGGGGDCDDHDHDERVKLDRPVAVGVLAVLRRTWNTHTDQLKPQYSPHVASYAAPRRSAVLCRA
jgi:hypothetical protein